MAQSVEAQNGKQQIQQDLRDAGSCLAVGAGVGTVGTASALLLGATCPICVVMAPALIGLGLVKGYAARKRQAAIRAEEAEAAERIESEG